MTESDRLERQVLAHRYLYYVKAEPIISDYEYDLIERRAREVCPPSSPVHSVGSSLPWSYSPEIIRYAEGLK